MYERTRDTRGAIFEEGSVDVSRRDELIKGEENRRLFVTGHDRRESSRGEIKA